MSHFSLPNPFIFTPMNGLVRPENKMTSKGIPNRATDLTMVLMRIVLSVSEDYIGINAILRGFEAGLDLIALRRKGRPQA
jgi:hypothetical protein